MAIAYSIPNIKKMTTYLEAILVFYWYEFNIKNYNIAITTDQFSIVIGSEQFSITIRQRIQDPSRLWLSIITNNTTIWQEAISNFILV